MCDPTNATCYVIRLMYAFNDQCTSETKAQKLDFISRKVHFVCELL